MVALDQGSCENRQQLQELANALTNWSFVEAHGAVATAALTAAEATANRLDHLHTGFVFCLTANADAVCHHFARAMAASQIALADHRAVPRAADAAQAAGKGAAEVLKRLAGDLVVTGAVDLAAVLALFNADLALRYHAAGRIGRSADRGFDFRCFLGRAGFALQCCIGHFQFPLDWARTYGLTV